MQKIGTTGDGKSAVATPDGKKPKEEVYRTYTCKICEPLQLFYMYMYIKQDALTSVYPDIS